MSSSVKLFTPGPVQVPRKVLREMSRQVISHRSSEFSRLLEDVVIKLSRVFQLENGEVVVLAGTGTTAVDAMLWSFAGKDVRILVLVNGVFGERIVETLKRTHTQIDVVKTKPGLVVDLNTIASKLEEREYDFVALVHNETSTGVAYKEQLLQELARIAYKHGASLLIDTVSGLGGEEFRMGKGIAAAASCSHKALAAPPGVAFVALTEDAIEILKRKKETYVPIVLDLARYLKFFNERKETPFTPPINVLYALSTALTSILDKGISRVIEEHRKRASTLYEELDDVLKPVPVRREYRSNTVVAFWTGNVDAVVLQEELSKQGYIVATGVGKSKNKMIRIGVMGDISLEDVLNLSQEIRTLMVRIERYK